MNVEFIAVRADEALTLADPNQVDRLVPFARLSDPLFAGMYNGECGCLIGFVPDTVLSDRAYVWLNDMPLMRKHPVITGLCAQRLIRLALLRYPTLVGHCNERSARWLHSLGAQINFPVWIIEAKHV